MKDSEDGIGDFGLGYLLPKVPDRWLFQPPLVVIDRVYEQEFQFHPSRR